MKNVISIIILVCSFSCNFLFAQTIKGKITSNNLEVPFANIVIKGKNFGVSADERGRFIISNIKEGIYNIIVTSVGMETKSFYYDVKKGVNIIDVELNSLSYDLNQVVITGTRTFKRKTKSPVIVSVINSKQIENLQACNLAEGLGFQSGIRLETDCQTCNYTQLRMNGLSGSYSQILINGKSILSPLTGLYGMEQIPANMIERIEIVRGGGSALYGSSAIGGVVNVITKFPSVNNYSFGYVFNRINSASNDKVIYGNANVIHSNKKSGATFFVNNRERMWYDHNNDNFSELPALKDNTFGTSFFLIPYNKHKLEINIGSIHEYRYGGEMTLEAPHFAMQAEERIHDILLGNLDYSFNFNEELGSCLVYLAAQRTNRQHYTGIRPEIGTQEDEYHLINSPYGTTLSVTKQAGFQLNYKINKFLGSNIFSVGYEYLGDDILDEILAYNYLIDQQVSNSGLFFQSDWIVSNKFNLLSGLRIDKHSFLDKMVISPRVSFLYNIKKSLQFRTSYSTGFRAPQAFDSDLHIAFAGGGISRVILDDDLQEENSNSISSSINFDKAYSSYIYGFTLEGFYTLLDDAFYLDNIGEDQFGDIFIKNNGQGATVRGVLLELRANLFQKFQFESGFTLQESFYNSPVNYSNNLPEKKEFLRSPNQYGYAVFTYNPSNKLFFSINYLHTGSMNVLHLAGSPSQDIDEFFVTPIFNTIGFKTAYTQKNDKIGVEMEYSIGIKNITNSYQQDFDTSQNRDSNFIYGPSLPRTFFFGLVLKSL